MNQARESRPAGNQAAPHRISGGDNPSLPSGPDEMPDAMLTESAIADLVSRNWRALDVWTSGYLAGHREGSAAAELNAEQAAGLAARKFYALETCELDTRRMAQHTASWAAVEASRTAMLGGA